MTSNFDTLMEREGLEAGDTLLIEGKGRSYRAVVKNTENPKTVTMIDDTGLTKKFDASTLKNEKTGEAIGGVSKKPLRLTDLEFEFSPGIELGDTVFLRSKKGTERAVFVRQSLSARKGIFVSETGFEISIDKTTHKSEDKNVEIIGISESALRLSKTGGRREDK